MVISRSYQEIVHLSSPKETVFHLWIAYSSINGLQEIKKSTHTIKPCTHRRSTEHCYFICRSSSLSSIVLGTMHGFAAAKTARKWVLGWWKWLIGAKHCAWRVLLVSQKLEDVMPSIFREHQLGKPSRMWWLSASTLWDHLEPLPFQRVLRWIPSWLVFWGSSSH